MATPRAALVDYENTKFTGHYLLVLVPTILLMKTQLTALCNSVPPHSDYQAACGFRAPHNRAFRTKDGQIQVWQDVRRLKQ